MIQIKFIEEPDETGLGRIIFDGKYYGVPAKAITMILDDLHANRDQRSAAMYAAGQESAKADGWRQCAVGQHTSQFCGQAEMARAEGAGAGISAALLVKQMKVVAAEREVSNKAVLALDNISKVPAETVSTAYDMRCIARATLAEIAAIRNQPAVKTYTGGKPNYVKEEA